MANTSKFIQISKQILLEYIYADSTVGSNDWIETDDTGLSGARIQILENQHDNKKYLFTEENPITETYNYRRHSVIETSDGKYAYLTTAIPYTYIDYDDKVSSTEELDAQLDFTTGYPNYNDINETYKSGGGILYDKIRLHFISGYDISELYDGFIFQHKIKNRIGKESILSSIAFLNTDTYGISNPNPFILGEKLYSNYIELRVPSYSFIVNDYNLDRNDKSRLGYILTSDFGFNQSHSDGPQVDGVINVDLKFISKTEIVNGFSYFTTSNETSAILNKTDEYNLLTAYINEGTDGDYFEVGGLYNGINWEDFIAGQNANKDTELVAIHDIAIFEQIGPNFIKTQEHTYIQSGDFSESYQFRPIIKNAAVAVSYKIKYTLRLFNKVDNTQIIKQADYASFDVKKYGKFLPKLNLGIIPTVPKIYNTILDDTGKSISYNNKLDLQLALPQGQRSLVRDTQYVTLFKERLNISASFSNIQSTPAELKSGDYNQHENIIINKKSISDNDKIYPLGEGIFTITPFDNFIMIVMYDSLNNEQYSLLDLTNMGDFYINFKSNNGEIKIKNYTNVQDINKTHGEILFKIEENVAKKIIDSKDKTFYITNKMVNNNNKSHETMIYSGTYLLPNEKYDKFASDKIIELNNDIKELNLLNSNELKEKDEIIKNLNIEIKNLKIKLDKTLNINTNLINNLEKSEINKLFDTIKEDKESKSIQGSVIKSNTDTKSLNEISASNNLGVNITAVNFTKNI